jgi:hypothetical protein
MDSMELLGFLRVFYEGVRDNAIEKQVVVEIARLTGVGWIIVEKEIGEQDHRDYQL